MIFSIKNFLEKNLVDRILLVLHNKEKVLEKFIFVLKLENQKEIFYDSIHLQMKDFFQKLNIIENSLKKIPQEEEGLSFKLQLLTNEIKSNFVPEEWSISELNSNSSNIKIIPVKSMTHEKLGMKLEFYIQKY